MDFLYFNSEIKLADVKKAFGKPTNSGVSDESAYLYYTENVAIYFNKKNNDYYVNQLSIQDPKSNIEY